MPNPKQIKSGDDVTGLMASINSGDDVTSIMNPPEENSIDDLRRKFVTTHPILKGGLLDPDRKTILPDMGKVNYGTKAPGIESLVNKIDEPFLNEEQHPYIRNARAFLAGTLGGMFGGDIMPLPGARTAKLVGDPELVSNLSKLASPVEAPKPRLALPPAPPEVTNPPRFIGGPSGGSGQVVDAAEAAVNPSKYAKIIGSTGEIGNPKGVDLGEVKEQQRLENLNYGPAEQEPGSRLKITDSGYELPPEAGSTRGGFSPVSNADLPYPLNIVPEVLRPRAVQSSVLGSLPEDFSTEPTTSRGYSFTDEIKDPNVLPFRKSIYSDKGQYLGDAEASWPMPKEDMGQLELPPAGSKYQSPESGYTGTGKPAEELHPNRLEPASEIVNRQHPNGDAPPLENVASDIQPPEEQVIPPAGTAGIPKSFKDINVATANVGSIDQVLESRAVTKPIVELVRDKGWDDYLKTVAKDIRELGDITQGMNSEQRIALGKASEGVASDEELASIPDAENKLTAYRAFLDRIFKESKVARGGDLGYIDDYFTHVEKMPEDFKSAAQDIFNYRLGKNAFKRMFDRETIGAAEEGSGEAAGIYDKGVGSVRESPFTKPRAGALMDQDYDVNRVGRVYVDSMARERTLRPAIEEATKLVKDLPDKSVLKEASEWYLKNVTRFDSAPQLHQAWQKYARFMIDTTSRSMLALNPHLQALHLMRLGPVISELGAKYSAIGFGNMLKNPAAAYRETAELGLLQNELYPWKFQTTNERINSLGNFKSMIDFIDRTIAYNGFKARYADSGLNATDAMRKALVDTKRVTFMSDPARAVMGLNPEYSALGTFGRLAAQYKTVPTKVVEWIARTGMQYKKNPAAAARALALLGVAGGTTAAGGPEIFHMPMSLTDWGAASTKEMAKILTFAIKGNIDDALKETALWLTPAGKSIDRLFE